MQKNILFSIISSLLVTGLISNANAFDAYQSEVYLNAYHKFPVEIKRLQLNIEILESDSSLIKTYKKDLNKCGISTTLNSCLNSELISKKAPFTFKRPGEEGVRYLLKGISKKYYDNQLSMQVVTVHGESNQIVVDRVEVFETDILMIGSYFQDFFRGYLKNEYQASIDESSFISHSFENYIDLLSNTKDSLSFFHVLYNAVLVASSNNDLSRIKEIIESNFEIINSTKDSMYQLEYLDFLSKKEIYQKESFQQFALSLLDSTETNVTWKAAILLALDGLGNERVRELLKEALKSDRYQNQLDALTGFFSIRESISDYQVMTDVMKEGSPKLSEAAYKLLLKCDFKDEHLPILKQLLNSKNHILRINAVNLINKIESSEGKKALIKLLEDQHPEVAAMAYRYLKERNISKADIFKFVRLLKSSREHAKIYALNFVNSEQGAYYTKAMLPVLKDESEKVREVAIRLLKNRDYKRIKLSTLKNLVSDKRARFGALVILNNYQGFEVTKMMIKNLTKVKDKEIGTLFNVIKSRDFEGNEFEILKDSYRDWDSDVREAVVKLMTKIPNKKTLKFLKKKLRFELSKKVRKALKTLIGYLEEEVE